MVQPVKQLGRSLFGLAERLLEWGFGSTLNPLHYLGALTIFFFWIVLVSGIWLFIFFRTSVDGAYESVEYLTHGQWYFGSVMRSLHRYASDAAVVTLVLHIAREWIFDHYRRKRWFSWITGVPLLWIVIPLGITGYWLVWDQLAQYVALTTAEMLDWLPIFTDSMARNFLSDADLSNRFFTLMAFLHLIGLPLFLVLGIWMHVLRISAPRINPPRTLMIGTLLCMVLLSLAWPAVSQDKANLAIAPRSVSLDWYYLLVYPLMKSWSPGQVWLLLVAGSALIFLAPWLPPKRSPAVARVDLDNCNGCQRCADDCPYGAIMMQARTDGSRYEHEAVVSAELCVSCGICVGACPTATPFRKASDLIPGIDLPDLTAVLLREQVEEAAQPLQGGQRVMVFGCAGSARLAALADAQTAVLSIECMAHLPPPFLDYILSRDLADGVMLAGCKGGGCDYRLGAEWTGQRINRQRDPYLRKRIDNRRIAMAWTGRFADSGNPVRALRLFREKLVALKDQPEAGNEPESRIPPWYRRAPGMVLAFALFGFAVSVFSSWPDVQLLQPQQAVVSLTFSHAGKRIGECRQLSQEELNKLPPNMRKPADCPRERWPVRVVFRAGDELLLQRTLPPSGIWNDGESTIYARFALPAGQHRLFIGLNDSGASGELDYQLQQEVELFPQQHVVIGFDSNRHEFTILQER